MRERTCERMKTGKNTSKRTIKTGVLRYLSKSMTKMFLISTLNKLVNIMFNTNSRPTRNLVLEQFRYPVYSTTVKNPYINVCKVKVQRNAFNCAKIRRAISATFFNILSDNKPWYMHAHAKGVAFTRFRHKSCTSVLLKNVLNGL